MGIIYLTNILHKILIYSKCTLFSVTVISRPFVLIIILEYTSNMVVHMSSKYTFIILILPIMLSRIQKIHLCIVVRLQLNWSHLQLMGHKLFFLDEN